MQITYKNANAYIFYLFSHFCASVGKNWPLYLYVFTKYPPQLVAFCPKRPEIFYATPKSTRSTSRVITPGAPSTTATKAVNQLRASTMPLYGASSASNPRQATPQTQAAQPLL